MAGLRGFFTAAEDGLPDGERCSGRFALPDRKDPDGISQHQNIYSQRGCIDRKLCEGGGGNISRTSTLWFIGCCTGGIGLLFLPFFKKCQYCGHNMWWNKHYGPDLRQAAFASTNQTA
ncbi:hypothetical protein ATY41_10685 [Leifsonia xyli subsp. xyli]|uniref:LITAF domain-containing protein n=1 Tax=Leifsonia xyli subsp. xyli TaxID=59736 RepID=A0A1E2SKD7_LEIXY|nr:hypothetical protein [Leifsonia xyli]ODA90219.1 hypothetical protein ATY41_10685 [Leifsonia xyli subsp. xyli]